MELRFSCNAAREVYCTFSYTKTLGIEFRPVTGACHIGGVGFQQVSWGNNRFLYDGRILKYYLPWGFWGNGKITQ